MSTLQTGQAGEQAAAQALQQCGYEILARNFRTREGEIDIVAQKGSVLVFVEVKTRANSRFAQAREFVTAAKQRRCVAAANAYLALHPTSAQPRFDVIEVYWDAAKATPKRMIRIENAFEG